MSQKTWNCFDCGQPIYFNRNVKRKDKPDKPQALDAPYTEGDQFPVLHECGKKKSYVDYQQLEQQQQQEKRQYSQYYPSQQQQQEQEQEIPKSKLAVTTSDDIKQIKNDIEYIKQLVEVLVKSLDKIQQTQNKEGVLFTTAKNLSGTTGNRNTENPGEKVSEITEEGEGEGEGLQSKRKSKTVYADPDPDPEKE